MLIDPRTPALAPLFPRQQRSPPGSTARLDPPPDHGEETYRGSGRLEGCAALVTGGDSGIGRSELHQWRRASGDGRKTAALSTIRTRAGSLLAMSIHHPARRDDECAQCCQQIEIVLAARGEICVHPPRHALSLLARWIHISGITPAGTPRHSEAPNVNERAF